MAKSIFFDTLRENSLRNRKKKRKKQNKQTTMEVSYYELTLGPRSTNYFLPHSIPDAIGRRQKD